MDPAQSFNDVMVFLCPGTRMSNAFVLLCNVGILFGPCSHPQLCHGFFVDLKSVRAMFLFCHAMFCDTMCDDFTGLAGPETGRAGAGTGAGAWPRV